MAHGNANTQQVATGVAHGPRVTSYDPAYECSFEHWTEVRRLVREADEESEHVHELADHGILVGV